MNTPLQMFLLIGQSNMAGRRPLEAVPALRHPNVLMFRGGEWLPAGEPLHTDITRHETMEFYLSNRHAAQFAEIVSLQNATWRSWTRGGNSEYINILNGGKQIMPQPYSFSFSESLMAQNAGVSLNSTHFDVDAILKAYDGIKPLAKELGADAPRPRLAGFAYPHVAALGAHIEFAEDGEPNVFPLIKSPAEIDQLQEPENYLAAPLIQARLKIAAELMQCRKDAVPNYLGHPLEGPITTAVLLMGQDFLTLPYDDPKRAHQLLKFCAESALNYVQALHQHFNGDEPVEPGPGSIPDDFAGMLPPELFDEFVAPYWNRIYDGLQATERHLHSELLREGHLPFLRELKIKYYDPSADQYMTPQLLSQKCPCRFMSRIQSWEMRDFAAEQLEKMYREIAACNPYVIAFAMDDRRELDKIKRLLKLAREMA